MRQTDASFSKGERLCGIKAVSELFSEGRGLNLPPVRVVYRVMPAEEALHPVRLLISVPKRHFKRAVDRNLIRRRIKESWRTGKTTLESAMKGSGMRLELAIVWIDTVIRPYDETLKAVNDVIGRLTRLKY